MGDENNVSDEEEPDNTSKRKRKHISEDKQDRHKEKKLKKGGMKTAPEKRTETANPSIDQDKEDIVEDFQFSSDED